MMPMSTYFGRFAQALFWLGISFCMLPAAIADVEVQQLDRVVAVVDREVITYRELQNRIEIVLSQLEKQNVSRPPQEVLEKQVVERLISDRLQTKMEAQTGLRVDDEQ